MKDLTIDIPLMPISPTNPPTKLSLSQQRDLKTHFDSHSTRRWQDIQNFISSQFGIEIDKDTIIHLKNDWGLTRPKQMLNGRQVQVIKAHFKDNGSSKTKEIQDFISRQFGIFLKVDFIQKAKKRWGLTSRAKQKPLSYNELKEFQIFLAKYPSASIKNMQSFFLSQFGINPSDKTVKKHKETVLHLDENRQIDIIDDQEMTETQIAEMNQKVSLLNKQFNEDPENALDPLLDILISNHYQQV